MQAEERELEAIRQLERLHNIDLQAFSAPPAGAPGGAAGSNVVHASVVHTGLAVASALRQLKLKYSATPAVGVLVCEPQDITAWVARRCVLAPPARWHATCAWSRASLHRRARLLPRARSAAKAQLACSRRCEASLCLLLPRLLVSSHSLGRTRNFAGMNM